MTQERRPIEYLDGVTVPREIWYALKEATRRDLRATWGETTYEDIHEVHESDLSPMVEEACREWLRKHRPEALDFGKQLLADEERVR